MFNRVVKGGTVIVQDLNNPKTDEVLSTAGIAELHLGKVVRHSHLTFIDTPTALISQQDWNKFGDFYLDVEALEDDSAFEISVNMSLGNFIDTDAQPKDFAVTLFEGTAGAENVLKALSNDGRDRCICQPTSSSEDSTLNGQISFTITVPSTHSAGDTLRFAPRMKKISSGDRELYLNDDYDGVIFPVSTISIKEISNV